mmetsp:Transcript_30879/g.73593  ORF Transcript_30879/g.73593 Transcript_30879/m.73593 type:complete len:216 (-) Transcript_30879:42-689(-)
MSSSRYNIFVSPLLPPSVSFPILEASCRRTCSSLSMAPRSTEGRKNFSSPLERYSRRNSGRTSVVVALLPLLPLLPLSFGDATTQTKISSARRVWLRSESIVGRIRSMRDGMVLSEITSLLSGFRRCTSPVAVALDPPTASVLVSFSEIRVGSVQNESPPRSAQRQSSARACLPRRRAVVDGPVGGRVESRADASRLSRMICGRVSRVASHSQGG